MNDKELSRKEIELSKYDGKDKIISSYEMKKIIQEKRYNPVAIKTDIDHLDYLTEGFREGEIITISGHTGNGKTSIAQSLTYNMSLNAIGILWFSYEMPPRQFISKFPTLPHFYLPETLADHKLEWLEDRVIEAKAKYDIVVIFIDHLHYLVPPGQYKNISHAIGIVMRELKTISIRHNVITFLIAHTGKTNKLIKEDYPVLEDIRDCLPGNQKIYNKGKRTSVADIKIGAQVLSRKSITELQKDKVIDKWKTGIKDIYKLTTRTNKTIECSAKHKFYAITFKKASKFGPNQNCGIQGWTELKDLKIGQKIAVVKEYPDTHIEDINIYKSKLLGWLIGDGHISKKYHTEITVNTNEEVNYIKKLAKQSFDLDCIEKKYLNKNAFRIYMSANRHKPFKCNQLKELLKQLKFNPTGKNKYVPEFIFSQSKKVISNFLSGLFQADGSLNLCGVKNINGEHSEAVVTLHTISIKLAEDVQQLLIRIGIISFLGKTKFNTAGFKSPNKFIYSVRIYGRNILKFQKSVGFVCQKKKRAEKLLENWNPKEKERRGNIFYDRIKSIEYIGKKETYDLSVEGHHCSLKNNSFCVNDIITHNSSFICQESDFVIFISREKDEEATKRKKELIYTNNARLYVAKNRYNGQLGYVYLTYAKKENLFKESDKNGTE